MTPRSSLAGTLALALMLASSSLSFDAAAQPGGDPASAQGAPPESAADDSSGLERADQLSEQAKALGRDERYAEALPLLQEAYSLKQSYDIAGNLGLTEAALGKWRDAAAHLAIGVRGFPSAGKPEHRQLLQDELAKARTHVTAVTVAVSVEGAQVIVDGTPIGTAPLADELFLEPGSHRIEAALSGYDGASEQLDAKAGATAAITLTLKERIGSTGPAGPGAVQDSPMSLWPAVVGGGVALALAGVGIAFRVIGGNQQTDADAERDALTAQLATSGERCPAASGCAKLETMYGDADANLNASTGLFAGAGVAALFAVAWAVLYVGSTEEQGSEATAAPDTAFKLTPLGGPGFVGAGASVRF